MFSKAKVGDKVWNYKTGWDQITKILCNSTYPIMTQRGRYTLSGHNVTSDKNPSIFWDEIKIEPPPKPKRMVARILRGWVNIYPESTSEIHITIERANRHAFPRRIACVEINQEYEVEE